MSQIAQPKSLEVSMVDCDFRIMCSLQNRTTDTADSNKGTSQVCKTTPPFPNRTSLDLRCGPLLPYPLQIVAHEQDWDNNYKQVIGISFSRESFSCPCHFADCLYLLRSPFLKRRLVDRPTEFVERLQPTNDAVKAKNLRYTFLFLRLPQKLGEYPPKIAGSKSSGLRI